MRTNPEPGKLLSWLPLAALAPLFAFILIARLKVGHWPNYGQPDPGTLHLPPLYIGSFISLIAAPLAAIMGVASLALNPEGWKKHQVALLTLGAALVAVGLTSGAASHLLNWLLD
jgi:hypothetical protein